MPSPYILLFFSLPCRPRDFAHDEGGPPVLAAYPCGARHAGLGCRLGEEGLGVAGEAAAGLLGLDLDLLLLLELGLVLCLELALGRLLGRLLAAAAAEDVVLAVVLARLLRLGVGDDLAGALGAEGLLLLVALGLVEGGEAAAVALPDLLLLVSTFARDEEEWGGEGSVAHLVLGALALLGLVVVGAGRVARDALLLLLLDVDVGQLVVLADLVLEDLGDARPLGADELAVLVVQAVLAVLV